METLLKGWLGGGDALYVLDEASAAEAREWVREVGRAQGLPPVEVERMAIVASELVHNQLAHARGGALRVRPVRREGLAGLEVVAGDKGPGLADPTGALRGGQGAQGSLGAGLPGVLRQADEVDVDVRWGEGTCVRARKYARPPRVRAEVGVLGRPHPDEAVCGDGAAWCWEQDALVLGVVDGLGHGPQAREAADRALHALREGGADTPQALLARCDVALRGSRGAAMGVVRLERDTRALAHACMGNVDTRLCAPGEDWGLACHPGVLGLPGPRPRGRVQQARLAPGALLVLHTDGLSTRTTVDEPLLFRRHPLEVAHQLLLRHGKAHDDALVAVVRLG